MQLAGWHSGNLEIQIAWLQTEQQVSEAAADQPSPAADPANQLFNLSQWPRERGILDAKTNRHLERHLPEKFC